MAHSLVRIPPVSASTSPISSSTPPKDKTRFPSFWFPLHNHDDDSNAAQPITITNRRTVALGLAGAFSGLILGEVHNARAANKRKPPPPPSQPEEKKDPSVSGVLAKVLASKKRKEAMKQTVAALREKGKTIDQPSSSSQ
ncbi:uncharacterized protein LOC124910281 [Impatiens glandulifera]|uniref:uncharacterized protein LOC124910281 n=1 Tax=Impatiens glandulifera TaxID=253017 RepID=UPI001FB15550|nr:uncharacterized protein LOC124910281 [Impatiens glandulifera]